MNNPISDFTDELGEQLKDTGKTFVEEVVKGIPQTAKQQVTGSTSNGSNVSSSSDKSNERNKNDKSEKKGAKVDPVTGKTKPSKQVLRDLQQKTAQVAQMKLKKVREELERQRLKVTDKKAELAPIETAKKQGNGPTVSVEGAEKAPIDEAVANTLKGSKSTGEFKGLVGG